jgi:hypothetical protein
MDKKHGWRRIWNKNYPAVFAERKIRTLKTYISLNSKLNYGDGTKWWNVVSKSVVAVNRIFQKKGGSPEEILKMDINARKRIESATKGLQKKEQDTLVRQPRGNAPVVGDSVRVRVASTKQLPRDYKGHLPVKEGVPTKWSLDVTKSKRNAQILPREPYACLQMDAGVSGPLRYLPYQQLPKSLACLGKMETILRLYEPGGAILAVRESVQNGLRILTWDEENVSSNRQEIWPVGYSLSRICSHPVGSRHPIPLPYEK